MRKPAKREKEDEVRQLNRRLVRRLREVERWAKGKMTLQEVAYLLRFGLQEIVAAAHFFLEASKEARQDLRRRGEIITKASNLELAVLCLGLEEPAMFVYLALQRNQVDKSIWPAVQELREIIAKCTSHPLEE